MKICVPSYKRSNNCIAGKWIKKAIVFCHEFEAKEYKQLNSNELVVMPDSIKGQGMAVIRNYIIDHFKDEDVVMIDDDVSSIGYFEDGERFRLSEDKFYEFCSKGFDLCKELKTILWGINITDSRWSYREYTPFSFVSVVLGSFFCISKHREYFKFDERLGLKEDWDYSLQVLNAKRRILRFNKYHYYVKHTTNKGGCVSYRTRQKEENQLNIFVRKWGKSIVHVRKGNINPIVKVPIDGV